MSDKITLLGPINESGAPRGVGPWEGSVPGDPRYDPELPALDDRRNVEDHYRHQTMDAIREDLKRRPLPFEVVVENLGHNLNIGSIMRTANAPRAARAYTVGCRRWNRRRVVATNHYLEVGYVDSAQAFTGSYTNHGLVLVGVDNVPGSPPLESTELPRRACLVFGERSNGLSEEVIDLYEYVIKTSQRDSTHPMNVGRATTIVMWEHARKLSAEQG